jgi:hypothetical protein
MVLIRKYGVWLALLLTLAATVWVSKQDAADELVTTTGRTMGPLNREKKSPITQQNRGESKQSKNVVTDSFTLRPFDNEVPKNIFTPFIAIQNESELNAAPVNLLPANPFTYVGKIIEDGTLLVFLVDGEKSHAVKSGDVIEETWQIKSITPPTMTLKYIPLKIELKMEIGANS